MATILRKLLAAGAAAALTVGISGCGGDVDQSDHDTVVAELGAATGTAESLQTMLEAAQKELADSTSASATEKKMLEDQIAALKKQIADAEKAAADAEAAVDAAAASAKAGKLLEALNGVPGISVGITLTAPSDGELTAEAGGYTMGDTPDVIEGWRGATLSKPGAMTVVYTDIADAAPTPFGGTNGLYEQVGGKNAYNVGGTADADADHILWTDAARAKQADGEPVPQVVTGDVEATAVTTFTGSVRKVPGTFSCVGTACMPPTEDADSGDLTAVGGVWTFSPDDPAATIDVEDKDGYLMFGWWLSMDKDGDPTAANVFHGASSEGLPLSVATDLTGLLIEGSATYVGGAAGKYAIASTSEETYEGGHFTANATLTANFDADSTAATDPDEPNPNDKIGVTVSGVIDNFMTGDMSRDSWTVTLKPFDADNELDAADNGVQGAADLATALPLADDVSGLVAEWSTGGAATGTGTWRATFYGKEDITDHPTAVTGEFDAAMGENDSIAKIIGAFGANKKTEE